MDKRLLACRRTGSWWFMVWISWNAHASIFGWEEGLAFIWNERRVQVDDRKTNCEHLKDHYPFKVNNIPIPGMEIVKSLCQLPFSLIGSAGNPACEGVIYNTHLVP